MAEGVDQHSDFRADPWERLAGTLRSYLRIVYGTATTARAEIRRLNGLHRTVGGPVREAGSAERFGASYSARDPVLALWVHATLVDSTLATGDAWLGPITAARRARFYLETVPIARLFGVPDAILPPDVDAFDAYVAAMLAPDGPIHPSATSRDLAAAVLHPPIAPLAEAGPIAGLLGPGASGVARLLRAIPAPAYDWLLVPSTGLLPPSLRAEYGLAWGSRERAISAWLVTAWGLWRGVLPPAWRWFPQALAADRRVASSGD